MILGLFFGYVIFSLLILYHNQKLLFWEIGTVVYLILSLYLHSSIFILLPIFILTVFAITLHYYGNSRKLISAFLFNKTRKHIPKLSKTEEEALNAGKTWFEKDIFTGSCDWDKLTKVDTQLTVEEQNFLDNETQQLCDMLDEWDITQTGDLSTEVWNFIKNKGFLGLVIDKKFGGKGFSARAHSDIVMKIASRSGVAAVSVMVPNSLGPGELLQHYGTDEQKNTYLPRLANGEDIPCFALTEPNAGSDATSIQSEAIVCYKTIAGKKVLGLNITLNKRWITLAPIATLIGVAVNLKDPEKLMTEGEEGITCVLISNKTENLEIGNRHLPANQPFMNGTVRGNDIFVPISAIIGGQKFAGQGWRMLVECLSIGRSISLPALSAASSSICYITTGAFAKIRRQFNLEIGKFEGVEEKLAEIAGLNYLINSTRLFTLAAVNQHKPSAAASAITKYFNTENGRIVINAAMDINAGRTVVVGPRNYLTNYYQGLPISITVEGANIMSRNLLIFGQGSIACHPFLKEEFYAISQNDKTIFHNLIWQHIKYFLTNFSKMLISSWTLGIFISTPKSKLKKYYQQVARLSHVYAFTADLALIYLGGSLKRKERLSARLGDIMGYLYMCLAVLNFYEKNNSEDDLVHAKWALSYCLFQAQKAFINFFNNFPSKILAFIMKNLAFPFGCTIKAPTDKLEHQLAKLTLQNNAYRDRLLKYVYLSGDQNQPVDKMEKTFQAVLKHADLYDKIKDIRKVPYAQMLEAFKQKIQAGVITKEEYNQLITLEESCWDAMQVDEFDFNAMKKSRYDSLTKEMQSPFKAAKVTKESKDKIAQEV